MHRVMRIWCVSWAVCLGFLYPALVYAVSPYEAVRQGNALYQAEQYPEAAQQYGRAADALPESAEILFNQGNALYKQQDYARALEHYTQALRTADRQLEGKVKYNLGNTAYQQALRALQKPQEATSHLRAAMQYYRDSLEVDPQQQDAPYNFELAQRLLRQLQPAPQRQKSPSQEQQKQQQDEQNQASETQPAPQQEQASEPQPAQQDGQDTAQASQESDQLSTAQQSPSPDDARQAAAQELRREDAERLLEAIRERARAAKHLRQQWQRSQSQGPQVEKDW